MVGKAVTYGSGSKIKSRKTKGENAQPSMPSVKGQLGFNGSKSGNGKGV